ncbi:MAG TPA: ABC transporter substrate-binding protein [Candidatus Angelobacter sp.]|nr:ABC transporter substrate-binding protein [Candidatus Angelobacter sp.]
MRKPTPTIVLPLIIALALVLAACTAVQQSPSPDASGPSGSPGATDGGATGGTVRIGWGGSPDSLNPGNGVLSEAYTLYALMYDVPVDITSEGEYVPELAEAWDVSEDGLTWTLTIRDDVTFHDGEPLTAEDVAFSIQLYKDTDSFPFLPSYATYFETIEAPDEQTVVLTTAEPLGNFEANMVFMYILPEHIWSELDDPVEFENEEMIGSGPFQLTNYSQGEFVELEAYEEYWGTGANVDGVIFRTISNPDARVTALTTGDVDAITEFPATAVSQLQNAENVNVHIADIAAGGTLRDVFFNIVDPENCPPDDGECTGHPALLDVEVRQALAMAMDKQQIIDVATLGTGSPGLSLVPPGLGDFYASEVDDWPYDPTQAAATLTGAGYTDRDGDGIRDCPDSLDCPTGDLTFRFNYPDDIDTGAREAELIQGMWREIGVELQIQGMDADTLTSICCPTFDFDVILWGWGSDPDPAFLLGVGLCDEITSGFSETGYCNPDFDELYYAQGVETDPDARRDMIIEMQRILVEDVPYIIPYYSVSIQAWRTDTFTGWLDVDPTLGLEDASSLINLRPAQ